MKRIKKILILLIMTIICTTGCTTDDMEGINIIVTNYPNEYITDAIYGKHATITSIYPDGVNIDKYKISKKQKQEYAYADLFIYNGLIEKERDLAVDLLEINKKLKIIDAAYVLETEYSTEELWQDPSSLLMMAQNVRLGIEEYASSTVIKKDIDEKYEKLKVTLSELDADYRTAVENSDKKTILVANSSLKYLKKFGFDIICIDNDATDQTLLKARELLYQKKISYIYKYEDDTTSEIVEKVLKNFPDVKEVSLHKLNIISDKERENNEDYVTISNKNLTLLKQELYQ